MTSGAYCASLAKILPVALCMGMVAYGVNRLCAGWAGTGAVGAAVGLFTAIASSRAFLRLQP